MSSPVQPVRIEFSVPFVRGKERPRYAGGHAYTPAATQASERIVWCAYEDACTSLYGQIMTAPDRVPVRLHIAAYGTMPKGRPRKEGDVEPYVYTPDADNIAKLVLDALNRRTKAGPDGDTRVVRQGAWMDDRQVVSIKVDKVARYKGSPPRTDVIVTWPYEF